MAEQDPPRTATGLYEYVMRTLQDQLSGKLSTTEANARIRRVQEALTAVQQAYRRQQDQGRMRRRREGRGQG